MTRKPTAPSAADPRPGHNPGYAEDQPRNRDDAQESNGKQAPTPDEGGLRRAPETAPDRTGSRRQARRSP